MYFPAWSAFSARPHPCIYFYSRIKMNPLSLGTFILSFGDRPNPSWKPLMSGAVSLALSASMPSFSQSICSFISLSFFAQLAMAIITLPSFTNEVARMSLRPLTTLEGVGCIRHKRQPHDGLLGILQSSEDRTQ